MDLSDDSRVEIVETLWMRNDSYLANDISRRGPRRSSLARDSVSTLRHIAKTRRLVTPLARLLATKSDVIAQIRKRPRFGNGHGDNGYAKVSMNLGDVQGQCFAVLPLV
jgi:magnesium transporter